MCAAVTIGFRAATYTVTEDVQSAILVLEMSGLTEFNVTVQFTTTAQSASDGQPQEFVCLCVCVCVCVCACVHTCTHVHIRRGVSMS